MLYLNPPFHIIDGVSLFSDHRDPLQYYFMPLAPKFTTIQDSEGKDIPSFQLLKYRGSAGSGGFLNFDVNIGIEQDALEDIRTQLKILARLDEQPRLAPVPLIDGTVKMMLFGKETRTTDGETTDEVTTEEDERFVIKIDQHAKPALYGNNQAAFSVELDANGVTLLEKAMQGELSPIGIVYSLDYLALRPAYSVRVDVNWDRVQKHIQEHFGVDAIFFSSSIDEIVDELIENRAIVIEVDTFVPEGEDVSGIISRRDQAVNEVRDMITDAFFEPSLNPVKESEDGWDKAQHVAERATAIAVTGGFGAIGTFSYNKLDYTRIDKKSLNFNMNERTTVKRSIYPQGHLSGLFRKLKQEGLDLNRFIIPVDLDDPWFLRRKVKVISRANFEEDSIQSINVKLKYGDNTKNVILESSNAREEVSWDSIIKEEAMEKAVTMGYQVSFKGIDSTERPIELESEEEEVLVENLEINPRELYSIVHVPILALSFPWENYPHIEVQTMYVDEDNNIRMDESFLLDKDHSGTEWKIFVRDPQKTQFQYKLTYRAADHKDIEGTWRKTDEERITIRDPYPLKRKLMVVPNFKWSEVSNVFVDLMYEDSENNVYEEDSFEFSEINATSKTFSVDLVDPDRRMVSYKVIILFKDGRLVEVPRSFTLERRIIVRSDMKGRRIIRIRSEDIDFSEKQLKKMKIGIRYEDNEAGLSYADEYTIKSKENQAYFEFDYVDDQKTNYEYSVKYFYENGLAKTKDWEKNNAEELIIPIN